MLRLLAHFRAQSQHPHRLVVVAHICCPSLCCCTESDESEEEEEEVRVWDSGDEWSVADTTSRRRWKRSQHDAILAATEALAAKQSQTEVRLAMAHGQLM